jgi:hypothetical protein
MDALYLLIGVVFFALAILVVERAFARVKS